MRLDEHQPDRPRRPQRTGCGGPQGRRRGGPTGGCRRGGRGRSRAGVSPCRRRRCKRGGRRDGGDPLRQHPQRAGGGTDDPQPARTAIGDRNGHAAAGRCGGWHALPRLRHPQDRAGLAAARQVRRSHGRRLEPPPWALRCDPDQRQPSGGGSRRGRIARRRGPDRPGIPRQDIPAGAGGGDGGGDRDRLVRPARGGAGRRP